MLEQVLQKLAHLLLTQSFSTFLLSHRIVVYMFLSECKDTKNIVRIVRITKKSVPLQAKLQMV